MKQDKNSIPLELTNTFFPDQTHEELMVGVEHVNYAAAHDAGFIAHLTRSRGNQSVPFDSTSFKERYMAQLDSFMALDSASRHISA